MKGFDYVRKHYGVPSRRGARVCDKVYPVSSNRSRISGTRIKSKGEKMEFMTLRDFLLLKEYGVVHYKRPTELVALYDTAKTSYGKWGNGDNIPVGSKVRMLVAGHGDEPGVVRTFGGPYEVNPNYFKLISEDGCSLVFRETWFKSFVVL